MTDELRVRGASAGAADEIDVVDDTALPTPPVVTPPKADADSEPMSRRPKARLSLRIPDDEVSRPSSPASAPASTPPNAAAPIAPGRIISINAPPSAAASSVPAPPAPSRVPAPVRAPVAPSPPQYDPDQTQPEGRAALAAVAPNSPDTDVLPVSPSDPPAHGERVASSDAVDAVELDEAESAAMLDAHRGLSSDDSIDIPVEEGEAESTPPSSEPEIRVEEMVVEPPRPEVRVDHGRTPAPLAPAQAAAAAPPSGTPVTPVKSGSFPPSPAGIPVGMSSSPNMAASVSANAPAARTNPTPAASPLAPPPMNDSAASRKRVRPWWEELFNDDFLRATAKISDPQIGGECDFIEESLGVAKGAMVLDLACGTGRHAIELTRRGYQVVGFDLSLPMLAKAAEEAQDREQKINFVQGDMREMTFDETFDGVYCWNTSFGFFEEERNAQVVSRVHKALRLGGQFLLDVANRDYVIKQSPSLCWFEGEGCICMDEMQVDWITSRMRVKRTMMLDDGRSKEIEYSIRLYALHELGKILHDHGFRVVEVSGRTATPGVFFGNEAPRTLILAEKR